MSSKIAIIGTGYVGLTTGACFAHMGHQVTCADIDPDKVATLNRGEIPILEPGLDKIVKEGVDSGRLTFVLGSENAVKDCEFAFLCVPTPQGEDDSADLSYIQQAAREIGPLLPSGSVVVNKSTVPVGSTKVVERHLGRTDVHVISNPEFLREGSAVQDFLHPDRVVIGCSNTTAAVKAQSLYLSVNAPIMVTDPASAETIKYASNAFLATKISYVNAIAAVCEAVGANVSDVTLGMGYDRRIGDMFLNPGPGWGGSCFPKDTRAMIKIAEDAGYHFHMLNGVVQVNEEQFDRMVRKVENSLGGQIDGAVVASWGLTFKANTDDLRESPAIEILNRLAAKGAKIRAYDPGCKQQLDNIEVVSDPYEAVDGADVLCVLTEWDDFKWYDMEDVGARMAHRRVVDARNLLDGHNLKAKGFTYDGVGRR